MRRSRLKIPSFIYGMRRDSALDEERLLSLRTLKNYFIDYSDGRIKVRKGYSRWNSTALASPATQLFWFSDLSQNENLLGIVDGNWYQIKDTGTHNQINTDAATAPRPIVAAGQRCFFATDSDVYWTDDSELPGGVSAFRLGIEAPTDAPLATLAAGEGNVATGLEPTPGQIAAGGFGLLLNAVNYQRLAAIYTPSSDQEIDSVVINLMPVWSGAVNGAIRVSIYTGAAEPTTLVTGAVTDWLEITQFDTNTYTYQHLFFPDKITLSSGTTYWMQIESDADYKSNYHVTAFYVAFSYTIGATAGTSLRYAGAWFNEGNAYMTNFALGGLNPENQYDYKLTFFNDTYKSESRPSPSSARVRPVLATNRVSVSTPVSGDGQVDYVAIYRRNIGTDWSIADDLITSDYKYVGKVVSGQVFSDGIAAGAEGAELRSEDHYLYDDTADEGEGVRVTALLPSVMTYWKGRIWFCEANSNVLYMSKKHEQDGSMGLTGDSVPDYFPLDNKLEINETSDIIALVPLSADELAVYFRNTSVWVIRGADDPLNPPPTVVLRQVEIDMGLIAPAAVDSIRNRHVFLTRQGLYDFKGVAGTDFLSGGIQTILDDIGDSYLDDSILVAHGDSIWLAVDEDEDGKLENIYILDIQRRIPTWRLYNYGVNINAMVVRTTGTEYRTLLAADADNNYILKLEDGSTDNGEAIVAELETQDLIAPNLATIFEVSIDAFYPNVAPVYEGEVIDALGEVHSFEMSPLSTDDIAGHKAYPLVTSAVGARVKIIQRTVNQNHLRAIDVRYVER